MPDTIESMMFVLSQRYQRCALGRFPTPVSKLDFHENGFDEIWIKHDDMSSNVYGGNKVRKLEFLLSSSNLPILTFGPWGSHHVLSTALHAKRIGRRTAAVLVPQYMTDHHDEVHQRILRTCDPVVKIQWTPEALLRLLPIALKSLSEGNSAYQICPPGGTTPRGTLGYVLGGLELAAQIHAGILPEPKKLFVPLGTGGTSVGIAIGLAMAGMNTETVAVRVVPRLALPEVSLHILTRRTLRLIRDTGLDTPSFRRVRIHVENGFSGKYAVPTDDTDRMLKLAHQVGVCLEATYSAKAFAALMAVAQNVKNETGPYLFWQTYAAFNREAEAREGAQ